LPRHQYLCPGHVRPARQRGVKLRYYGLTNALDSNGQSVDALDDTALSNKALNGRAQITSFWDYLTDREVPFVLADITQQLISRCKSAISSLNGSNQLVVANVPIGQNGLVLGRTNLLAPGWQTNATFVSSNATQTIYVPLPVRSGFTG